MVRERPPGATELDPQTPGVGVFSERRLDYKVKEVSQGERESWSRKCTESLGVLAEEIRGDSLGW